MKNSFILSLVLIVLICYKADAQSSFLNFSEESILLNGSPANVGQTLLKGDAKELTKFWKDFVKDQLGERMKEEKGILFVEETVINQITDKRGDLISYMYSEDDDISFNLAYKLGYDVYLNSNQFPEEFEKMMDFLNYFVYNYYDEYLPEYMKEREKTYKMLKGESKKIDKTIKRHEKKNKKLKKTVLKNDKAVAKSENKRNDSSNQDERAQLDLGISELDRKSEEITQEIAYNEGLIETQQSVRSSLVPKMDVVNKEINSAKLTLIEVRAQLKTRKK